MRALTDRLKHVELVGAFSVAYGDVDSALHILRYKTGFEGVDECMTLMRTDATLLKQHSEIGVCACARTHMAQVDCVDTANCRCSSRSATGAIRCPVSRRISTTYGDMYCA